MTTINVESTTSNPLRISAGTPGRKPQVGEILFDIEMKTGDTLNANLSGSELSCSVATTADWTISLKKNGVLTYTGTIPAGTTTGSFSAGSAVTFVDGDFWSGTCITPQDSTALGIRITLIGTRTQ